MPHLLISDAKYVHTASMYFKTKIYISSSTHEVASSACVRACTVLHGGHCIRGSRQQRQRQKYDGRRSKVKTVVVAGAAAAAPPAPLMPAAAARPCSGAAGGQRMAHGTGSDSELRTRVQSRPTYVHAQRLEHHYHTGM